jgi:hypothetical protein
MSGCTLSDEIRVSEFFTVVLILPSSLPPSHPGTYLTPFDVILPVYNGPTPSLPCLVVLCGEGVTDAICEGELDLISVSQPSSSSSSSADGTSRAFLGRE